MAHRWIYNRIRVLADRLPCRSRVNRFMAALFLIGFCECFCIAEAAQTTPAGKAVSEEHPPSVPQDAHPPSGPFVLELFSSEVCMFCPRAEAMLGDLVATKNVIGLTCMVDYMQTGSGGPGQAFCSARQSDYSEKLRTGPDYTPQIIINGSRDVVGDKPETVTRALEEVGASPVLPIVLASVEPGRFSAVLPDAGVRQTPLSMTLFFYHRKAHGADPRSSDRVWTNLVYDLKMVDSWDGAPQTLALSPAPASGDGVALLAQDPVSGALVAAGIWSAKTPDEKTEP